MEGGCQGCPGVSTVISQPLDGNTLPWLAIPEICDVMWKTLLNTGTNPIIHYLYPPKICKGFAFDFSWEFFMSQEKLQTMVMRKFWGVIEVYYGIVQVVNKGSCWNISNNRWRQRDLYHCLVSYETVVNSAQVWALKRGPLKWKVC